MVSRVLDSLLRATGVDRLVPYVDESVDSARVGEWSKEQGVESLFDLEAYTFAEEAAPVLADLIDDGGGGVIRADLVEYLVANITRTRTQREIIEEFQPYLTDDQFYLLKVAMSAENLREMGKDDDSRGLIRRAERKFGPLARKMNNLYATGYLARFFLFWLKMMSIECQGDVANTRQVYQRWFSQQLKFFERGIFVSRDTTGASIMSEITARLASDRRLRNAAVWAAGIDQINTAHDAVAEWVSCHDSFAMAVERGHYGGTHAVKIIVFDVAKNPELRPSRLPAYWWKE